MRRPDIEDEVRASFTLVAERARIFLFLPKGDYSSLRSRQVVLGPNAFVVHEMLPSSYRTLKVSSGVLPEGPPAFYRSEGDYAGYASPGQLSHLEALVDEGPSYYVDAVRKVLAEALSLGMSEASLRSLLREEIVRSVMEC